MKKVLNSTLSKNGKTFLNSVKSLNSGFVKFSNKGLFNKRSDIEGNRSKNRDLYWMTEADRESKLNLKGNPLQFSKTPILDNYGELPLGEIPEPLKYVRDFKMTTLENGIRVCTESWNCPTAAVGVYVDAGSRYETPETCGTSHFLEHLLFKGTKNRSKNQFENEIEVSGSTLDAYTSREHTLFHMTCFKNNIKSCVDILSDMTQNPLLGDDMITEEKDTITQELEHSNKDPQETIMEAVHFNSFRDHMIGSPILGDIDNIQNVNKRMVEEYFHANYVGKNLIIIGTGGVNHEEFVQMVADKFGNMNKNAPSGLERPNVQKPHYTPSCMFMRDDELYNSSIGVFYDAPSWTHEDYYTFMLLERVLGQYQLDRNGVAHLNDPKKQYSMLETYCGSMPDVQRAVGIYSPYKDCGLFGTFLHGNECWTRQMTYTGIFIPASYGNFMNQVEVYRARARLYHELLSIQSPADVLQFIGPQIQYLGRRVHRSEIAKRVSYLTADSVRKVAREWLFDAEPSIVAYGPIEAVSSISSYRYFKINSYVTSLNLSHTLNN